MRAVRIYGYAASINVRKVLWTCDEIGIPFTREDSAGARNPVGLVPVLEDDGATVWESNTIVRYLAASRGRSDLLPDDPKERANVENWMDWQGSDLNNTWRYAFQALVRRNPDYQDPRAIAVSTRQFTAAMGIVDAQLRKTAAYVAGATFTVADVAIGLAVQRWFGLPCDKPGYADVRRYYELLCERPAFARHGRDGGP